LEFELVKTPTVPSTLQDDLDCSTKTSVWDHYFLACQQAAKQETSYSMPLTTNCRTMGFSTKEMHIAFFDHSTPKAFSSAFSPLSSGSLAKLISAVGHAVDLGETKDVTLIATFCSDIFLQDEEFASLMSFLETHGDVKRIASTMPDALTVVTAEGFIVTIRLVGCKKFVDDVDHCHSEDDDSFEAVEDLTQRVLAIEKSTPQHKK
jgi:hypothetical protein